MPPRSEEELDPVTLHNQVRWNILSSSSFVHLICHHLPSSPSFGRGWCIWKIIQHQPSRNWIIFYPIHHSPLKPSQMSYSFIVNMETMIWVREMRWWLILLILWYLSTYHLSFWPSSVIAADLLAENAHLTFSFLSQVHLTIYHLIINYLSQLFISSVSQSTISSRSNMSFWKRSH